MIPPLGTWVWSVSIHRADDDLAPVGGLVIDWGEETVRVVGPWRGRVQYWTLPYSDLDPGSDPLVNSRTVKRVLRDLVADEARSRNPLKHDDARRVLAGVLAQVA